MKLSTLYAGSVPAYLEYAWLTTPAATEQSLAADTNETLTLTNEIADTDDIGSISSNTVTVPAGTYYFEAYTLLTGTDKRWIFGLYNGSSLLTARTAYYIAGGSGSNVGEFTTRLSGQFVLASSGSLTLRILSAGGGSIGSTAGMPTTGDGTLSIDQRTTLQLWKVA